MHIVKVDEGDRQLILLALGELAKARPGFDYALGEIAKKFAGFEMFEEFRDMERKFKTAEVDKKLEQARKEK